MSSDSRIRLTVALRVLNAITSYTMPSDEDIAALRTFVPASEQFRPPDELARGLIQEEVEAAGQADSGHAAASGQ